MKPIALTGDPNAQDAVGVALVTLCARRDLPLKLFAGVTTRLEGYHVREAGGELWHCGDRPPLRDLVGYVDRVVDAVTGADLEPEVERHLDAMLSKARIAE